MGEALRVRVVASHLVCKAQGINDTGSLDDQVCAAVIPGMVRTECGIDPPHCHWHRSESRSSPSNSLHYTRIPVGHARGNHHHVWLRDGHQSVIKPLKRPSIPTKPSGNTSQGFRVVDNRLQIPARAIESGRWRAGKRRKAVESRGAIATLPEGSGNR
jgi:hypothetical protein